MQELTKKEMLEIVGGINITATLIATLIKGAELSFEIGQTLGGTLRRLITSETCKI